MITLYILLWNTGRLVTEFDGVYRSSRYYPILELPVWVAKISTLVVSMCLYFILCGQVSSRTAHRVRRL